MSTAITPAEVGSYFVRDYFKFYREQRSIVYKFYTDASSVVHIHGGVTKSASGTTAIDQLIMSSNFTEIEADTTNCLESLAGGILVAVSGSLKSGDLSSSRKFVQNFFLAPQEIGYFVLNDVFHVYDDVSVHHPETEQNVDHLPVPEHPLEEPTEYVKEDLPVQEEASTGPEEEALKEDSALNLPKDDSSASSQNIEQVPQPPPNELVEEPRTFASIVRAKSKPPAPVLRVIIDLPRSQPPAAPQNRVSRPPVKHRSPVVKVSKGDSPTTVVEDEKADKGESHSIYVKNLPFAVTNLDILEEFKKFGKIKDNGVYLRNRKDIGVCFAFVNFEDAESVQSAIKASPIQVLGRKAYIEERRPSNAGAAAARGGRSARGGRGRGGRGRGSGRGSEQNGVKEVDGRSNGSDAQAS